MEVLSHHDITQLSSGYRCKMLGDMLRELRTHSGKRPISSICRSITWGMGYGVTKYQYPRMQRQENGKEFVNPYILNHWIEELDAKINPKINQYIENSSSPFTHKDQLIKQMIHLHNPQLNFEEHPEDYQAFKTQKGLMSFDDAWLERQPEEQRLGIFAKELRYKKNITVKDLHRRRLSEYEKYNAFEAGTQSPSYVELYKWTVKLNANQEEREKMLRLRAYSITPEEYEAVKHAFKKYEGYLSFDHEPDNWLSKQPEKEQFWIYAKELQDYIGVGNKSDDAVNGLMSLFRWEKHGVLTLEKIDACADVLKQKFLYHTEYFNAEKFKALARLVIAPEPVVRPVERLKEIPHVASELLTAIPANQAKIITTPIIIEPSQNRAEISRPETTAAPENVVADSVEIPDSIASRRMAENRELIDQHMNKKKDIGKFLSQKDPDKRSGLYVKAGRLVCRGQLFEKEMATALSKILASNEPIVLGGCQARDNNHRIAYKQGITSLYSQEERKKPEILSVSEEDIRAYESGAKKIPLQVALAYHKYFGDNISTHFSHTLFYDCLKDSNEAIDARTKAIMPLSAEMVGTMTSPETGVSII